jgi:hypothetical protein
MTERVILADCCEDWIVEWGGFYDRGASFVCPECATAWTKVGADSYRRADERTFALRTRQGPRAEAGVPAFPYLAAADGHEPNVERCCAKILLRHGASLRDGPFTCPVCRTTWQRSTERVHGFDVPVFARPGLAEPVTIQPGTPRPFIVPLSEYTPPRG